MLPNQCVSASLAAQGSLCHKRLNNLAVLYAYMDRFAEAEPLMEEALAILEATLPADHPNTAATQKSLATIRAKLPEQP